MAIAIVASAVVASTAVHANPSNNIVLVPPTDLPEFSRQRGDAILVHEAIDDVRSYTGIPILKVSLSYGVNIADLDLATQDGPMALEKRVKEAAKAACGWDLRVAGAVRELPAVTAEEVGRLRRWDPEGWFLRA